MSIDSTQVEVHPDAPSLATAIAGALLRRIVEAQADGAVPRICLTGGSIADAVHHELARLSPTSDADWSRVELWWGDERFVAPDSPERNAGAARAAFVDTLGVPADQVHEMPSTHDAADLEAAGAAYAETVRAHLGDGFEVMMLGVGPDGHVASLFPGRPELLVADRDVVVVTDSPKPPPERVSLSFPALNRSRAVWFLVSGDGKAEAVSRALSGSDPSATVADVPDPDDISRTPAVGVQGTTETVWFLDKAAASLL